MKLQKVNLEVTVFFTTHCSRWPDEIPNSNPMQRPGNICGAGSALQYGDTMSGKNRRLVTDVSVEFEK